MAVLTCSLLLLFAFLRFNHSVQFSILVIYRKVFKDGTLVLIIMNQRSYQIEGSINDYQCTSGLPESKLHLIFILPFLAIFLLCISLRSVIIQVFKFFIYACSDILAYM
jgi:hypothetical protein